MTTATPPGTPVASTGACPTIGWVLADDLSGAAEVAGALLVRGVGSEVLLAGTGLPVPAAEGQGGATVVDLDSRALDAAGAGTRLRGVLTHAGLRVVLVKIDSLWRGHVALTLRTLRDNGFDVVLAGALPALGRTVVDGRPLVAGRPLAGTDLWELEPGSPPERLDESFGLTGAVHVDLPTLRSPQWRLPAGDLLVLDGETDEDLRTAAAAAVQATARTTGQATGATGRRVALVGTAGLVAAAAETGLVTGGPPRPGGGGRPRPVTVAVGSGSSAAAAQIAHLRSSDPERLAVEVAAAGTHGSPPGTDVEHLLTLGATRRDPRTAVAELAERTVRVAGGHDLVLTGGETARAVLDRLGVRRLRPVGQVAHGAVVSTAEDGRLVATKPGSFGGPAVLAELVTAVRALRGTDPTTPIAGDAMTSTQTSSRADADTRPVVAVTMGDGAGVGPEVTVGALVDEAAYRDGRPVVVGDAHRLRLGAQALGLTVEVVPVERVADAEFTPGRINVIDPQLLPADLPWGRISPEAGHAAHEYVRIACELAVAGEVQAICTAPLNKAALHAAGHLYPGHTELLAHFTGVEEVSMMLTTPKIKVIHVTTHIGLIDAVARIEPGLVERTIRRGHDALVRAGIASPRIGVCAINPHAGENGLFGYGEEAEKVTPGIEAARAAGVDAVGPLPADTAFFLGGRGDYDLLVAMYHDQGHGPVKVLGIEAGVNITVGLPVIRTSVDHGTAFDIAGSGKVEVGSMIEALRQAVELAATPPAERPREPVPA
ncbi:4-hydroxythreonine-4-phosphate dehydrogenase PdxA [Kineococcus sp. SYSU DK003]|uniref:4-hydroxythreonine-4-phosphate dehydrogenase PdxA n=1 Tax=Kineococcus sp. SYSU DK003 TaxID=3383124 RepID=UPI003D7CF4DE